VCSSDLGDNGIFTKIRFLPVIQAVRAIHSLPDTVIETQMQVRQAEKHKTMTLSHVDRGAESAIPRKDAVKQQLTDVEANRPSFTLSQVPMLVSDYSECDEPLVKRGEEAKQEESYVVAPNESDHNTLQTKITSTPFGHVDPEEARLFKSGSTGDLSRPVARVKMSRRMSTSDLTTQQQANVNFIKNRGILVVKTQADSLHLEKNDYTYRDMRRWRRQHLTGQGVQFGVCEIREYPVTLGDNPGGNWGPPLTLSWDHDGTICMSLDEFESQHPPRRTGSQMNLPRSVREDMLRNAGFSWGEIQAGSKEVNKSRGQRRRTRELQQLTGLQELTEKLSRGTSNAIFRRGKKKQERTYLQHAMEVHQMKVQQEESEDELIDELHVSTIGGNEENSSEDDEEHPPWDFQLR